MNNLVFKLKIFVEHLILVIHQTCGQLVKLEKLRHAQGVDIIVGSSTNLLLGTTIKEENRGTTPCEDRQWKASERVLLEDEFEDNDFLPEEPPKMPENELNEYPSWSNQISGKLRISFFVKLFLRH